MNQQAMPSALSLRISPVLGWNTSTPLTLTWILSFLCIEYVDVRFSEDYEEVACAGVFEVAGHVEVSVHSGFQYGDPPKLVEVQGMGVVVEGAGDEHVKGRVSGLAHCIYEIGSGNGSEFRADEDSGAFLGSGVHFAFEVSSLTTDQVTRARASAR